ncbi:MAG TPA: HDOD domain-containing protein [Steroidobacteraceae bacterium]|jgi:HD-like signal output (HDOD) protein|nr:HDOD domain-containing protein [Steroidobacteraceae bacterium]
MSQLPPTTRSTGSTTGSTLSAEERAAALAFLQKLAGEVSDGSIDLPCFPNVVVRISTALADANTTVEQVAAIVGTEPRLAARILQVANSAAFNTSGKPLTDLKSAITRLGHRMVHGTAMSYAMVQMKNESVLRAIAQPLNELWSRSIAVGTICRVVARRTKMSPDEAFLTGLLHGIGHLYIMARAAIHGGGLADQRSWMDLLLGWQAPIGKAVLESWGFAEEMFEAVGEQNDRERRWKHEAGLSDVLIASLMLNEALSTPEPRHLATDGVGVYATCGITAPIAPAILSEAERQIRLVHEALV